VSVTTGPNRVDSFERFFLDEHPKLVAMGLGWTGNPDTARELSQEALARAYRAWDRVEHLDIPGAWVRRVMVNLLIDDRRTAHRAAELNQRLAPPVQADGLGGPDVLTDDDRWWLAVRALPDRERAAVTLHYLEDLPIAEVAQILEIAPGTVKSSLAHARQKLRAALIDQETDR